MEKEGRINILILFVAIIIISAALALAISEKELGILTFQLGNKTINISVGTIQEGEEFDLNSYKGKLDDKTYQYINGSNDEQENDFILVFENNIKEDILSKTEIKKQYKRFKGVVVKGKIKYIKELIENNEIKYIELDQNLKLLGESIPYNIEKTNAPNVWDETTGKKVKIAVLDTGIGKHKDLKVKGGVSFVSPDFNDDNGHGTAVAGVIAALLNDKGIAGVAPDADLYAVKIMEGSNGGLSNAIAGVEWAIDNNIDIVSMSFGMESYSQIFKEVLEEAYNNGILLVAAAGNEEDILYPAKYSDVIAVGAVDKDNNKAGSYGYELELVAPGVDINSTSLNDEYFIYSGTSMAAPHVTGVAALIKAYNNSLTNAEIRAKLRNDALDLGAIGKDDYYGYGLVRVNLETTNITLQNESYFYEVFNITNYGTEYEDYKFWLNGTGTVDDVDFPVGLYLVKKYVSDEVIIKRLNVTEEGIIRILSSSAVLYDDFTEENSSNTDGFVWVNGNLKVYNADPGPDLDAECFDYDSDGQNFDACYYYSGAFADCETYSQGLISYGMALYDVCTTGFELEGDVCTTGVGQNHTIANTTNKWNNDAYVVSYYDCDNSNSHKGWSFDADTYYVIDAKRAVCGAGPTYTYQGRYGIGYWWNYQSTSCVAGNCDSNLDEINVTTKTGTIPSPCETGVRCNGTIQVITEDSTGQGINNSYIKLNGISNGTTDEVGQAIIWLYNKNCGVNQNISVYCFNNQSRFCGEKSTALDFSGDNDSLTFDCNLCKDETDLKISLGDININSQGSQYNVSVVVHTENINANNVIVSFFGVDKSTSLIVQSENKNATISSITSSNNNVTASILMDLEGKNIDYIHIYVDPNNDVDEKSEDNNYVLRPFLKIPIVAYLNISTKIPKADEAIEEYLKLFMDTTTNQNNADVTISIGGYASIVQNLNWCGFLDTSDHKNYIFAYGNDIEGIVAAVKKLISDSDIFLSKPLLTQHRVAYLDKYDTSALSVMDLMHNDENTNYYRQNNDNFKNVITKILNDNNYEIAIKTVKTVNDNTTLRLKHVNTDYSANFKDAITNTSKPVVFAGGIFSNLFTWEENNGLAKQLATDSNYARDVWEIELTGGPLTECSTCPDYTYNDLVDYYWPALVAGVTEYSGENKIDYIGYSNGCRVALSSLNNYSSSGKNNAGHCFNTESGFYDIDCDLPSNVVDKFFGLGCPITLNDTSGTSELMRELKNGIPKGYIAISKIRAQNLGHIKRQDYAKHLNLLGMVFGRTNEKISTNLMEFYNNISIATNTSFSIKSNIVTKSILFAGTKGYFGLNHFGDDGVIPLSDMQAINSYLDNSSLYLINVNHGDLITDSNVRSNIRGELK
ncbi:MAG: Subtilisin-like protein serine protease [Parcubacteria group bacterium GW2011_GWA2_31_28]|nr:MAG: Subtilisin-like protein serine protease [Parcubacteria group bacterium GW2011_GWA2_31_28]